MAPRTLWLFLSIVSLFTAASLLTLQPIRRAVFFKFRVLNNAKKLTVCALFANKVQVTRALDTIKQIRSVGQYKADIVLVGGSDWSYQTLPPDTRSDLTRYNVITHHFSDMNLSTVLQQHQKYPVNSDGRTRTKLFQWHKMYLFSPWFAQWSVVLYIDAGCKIGAPITPFFELSWHNTLFAHSDAYPTYVWKLIGQFDSKTNPNMTQKLEQFCPNITRMDYFQSGILLFDTKFCSDDVFDNLTTLMNTYTISRTNEQGIFNLYFNCELSVWRQIPLNYINASGHLVALYDSMRRNLSQTYTIWKW